MPKRRSSGIDLRLRLTQNLPGTDRMARSGLASGVFLRVELPQELVTACRPVEVLLHRLLEEGGHVLVPGVAGVADVLAVVVARLEGVVLHRDEIEDHVAEACLTCCRRCSPHWYRLDADALRLPLADSVNRPAQGSASGSHRTDTDSFVSTTSLPVRVGIGRSSRAAHRGIGGRRQRPQHRRNSDAASLNERRGTWLIATGDDCWPKWRGSTIIRVFARSRSPNGCACPRPGSPGLLQQAEADGIVQTVVVPLIGLNSELKQELETRYSLAEVHIIEATSDDEIGLSAELGAAAAAIFATMPVDTPVVGLPSW